MIEEIQYINHRRHMMKKFTLIFLSVLFTVIATSCASASKSPESVTYEIEMTEFGYTPDTINLIVGQEATLIISNSGALTHEVMIGKEVLTTAQGAPGNFTQDMFENHEPVVVAHAAQEDEHAEDSDNDGHESEHEDNHTEDGHGHEDDHSDDGMHGFMVAIPGSSHDETSITFTVTEDMVGEWEIGCFLDGGSHYLAGMVGTVIVSQ
jgi:plastocyanin